MDRYRIHKLSGIAFVFLLLFLNCSTIGQSNQNIPDNRDVSNDSVNIDSFPPPKPPNAFPPGSSNKNPPDKNPPKNDDITPTSPPKNNEKESKDKILEKLETASEYHLYTSNTRIKTGDSQSIYTSLIVLFRNSGFTLLEDEPSKGDFLVKIRKSENNKDYLKFYSLRFRRGFIDSTMTEIQITAKYLEIIDYWWRGSYERKTDYTRSLDKDADNFVREFRSLIDKKRGNK